MSTMKCQNCGVSYGPDDMFCENCGYDFITGSLPVDGVPGPSAAPGPPPVAPSVLKPDAADAPSAGAGAAEAEAPNSGPTPGGDVPRLRITIAVDRTYFDQVVNDGEIEFPDPVPADQELALAGDELHIGRTSESRAIHPDIDVADLTGDQAVSSRHAVLRVADDGTYTLVDVGSTNGTFIDDVESDAITHGVPLAVKAGTAIYVGAWTRLSILE
jgi:hypothetical protein